MTVDPSRLDLLILGRRATRTGTLSSAAIAAGLSRYAPTTVTGGEWAATVDEGVARTASLDAARALGDRLGRTGTWTWKRLSERVFPALALGLGADDDKAIAKLTGRDEWTAAIAGRALGLWNEGPPPSLSRLCDAYTWRALGLAGRAKRCPPEIRSVFLQRELQSDPGPPDRLLRLLATRELGAARPDLTSLRDALVRMWLLGTRLEPGSSFSRDVRDVARLARIGVFGDRKVFISAAWEQLRRTARWAALSYPEFQRRLLDAHRAGSVELARADLVSAMDQRLVADSETLANGASFHFIVREEA